MSRSMRRLVSHPYSQHAVLYLTDGIGYHASGTCAMGKDDNPMAVLDNKLRVKGVAGLRVADCSVMPTLHGGHTQMPAYGIGERCADFIKETW